MLAKRTIRNHLTLPKAIVQAKGSVSWLRDAWVSQQFIPHICAIWTCAWLILLVFPSLVQSDSLKGDINQDGSVGPADAIMALQILSGSNPGQPNISADVNSDAKMDLVDVIYILQASAGLRGDTTSPTVSSIEPVNDATGVTVNSSISVTFSEAMDASTITTSTFTLKQGETAVFGIVTFSGATATFKPSSNLLYGAPYTATITTGVKDLAKNALASNYSWTFTTGAISTVTEGNVTIEYMGSHSKVAIDLTGGTTRLQTGENYAKAIKRIEPQIEVILDSYLSEMVGSSNSVLSYFISLANQIKANAPTDLEDEALGVTHVFNSTTDSVNDGILSANEFWVLQVLPELVAVSCSAVSVFSSSSATGKTIVGRNLDGYRGSSYQLSKLHSVTVIKRATTSVVSIGFLGWIGCMTCFNDSAVFAAYLQSDRDGSHSASGKRASFLDGRYALENFTTLTDVANYLKIQSYAVNHLWFLSDANESKVLENCIDTDCHARELRSCNSSLNEGISWGIANAIGAVNSFVLNGNIDNHSGKLSNTERWSSLISQTNSYLGGGNTVSIDDMKGIISYHSGASPGNQSAGDLYCSSNGQTIVFQPATFTTDIAFTPVGGLPNEPAFRTVFSKSPF